MDIQANDVVAVSAVRAIRSGDLESLRQLLREHAHLVKARIGGQRTLLHVATDWPCQSCRGVLEARPDARAGRGRQCVLVRVPWGAGGDGELSARARRQFELAWTRQSDTARRREPKRR